MRLHQSVADQVPGALCIACSRWRFEVLALLALLAEVIVMAAVSIRNLDDTVRERLRVRAAAHGRSMEAEMRAILAEAVRDPGDDEGLLGALAAHFGELGGVDLVLPSRSAPPRDVDFTT
jgi:antitoxin FitA